MSSDILASHLTTEILPKELETLQPLTHGAADESSIQNDPLASTTSKMRKEAHSYYLKAENYIRSSLDIKNFSLAMINYRKASDLGHAKAQTKLSSLESYLPNESSLKTRYRRALRLAKEGDVTAQVELAQMCEFGLGVKPNFKRAMLWYKRASAQNSGYAQYRLGQLYTSGVLEDNDVSFAQRLDWIQSAAENGELEAQFKLAEYYLKKPPLKGDIDDEETLKDQTFEYVPEKAFHWYKRSAEGGHLKGQIQTGQMLKSGIGVTRNYEQALFWFNKSLNQGYEPARQEIKNINTILDDIFLESLE